MVLALLGKRMIPGSNPTGFWPHHNCFSLDWDILSINSWVQMFSIIPRTCSQIRLWRCAVKFESKLNWDQKIKTIEYGWVSLWENWTQTNRISERKTGIWVQIGFHFQNPQMFSEQEHSISKQLQNFLGIFESQMFSFWENMSHSENRFFWVWW